MADTERLVADLDTLGCSAHCAAAVRTPPTAPFFAGSCLSCSPHWPGRSLT
jgi:hypothetical protein|eukprot:COSAG06_NODE_150_length_22019_cov_17.221031_16_plen_51_part_00